MILRDARHFRQFGQPYAVWVTAMVISAASLSVFVAGCKQSKTGSVLDGTPAGQGEATAQRPLWEMTPMEVTKDPAAYGFSKSADVETRPVPGMEALASKPSKYAQWTKQTSDGKLYVLTIQYDTNGKIAYAKWGGF